jgi:hypothetical protein
MGYSAPAYNGPAPTPPVWPNGSPALPNVPAPAPVQPLPNMQPTQNGAGQGYWYAIKAGNPDKLSVAIIVQKAYKLDPDRDRNQIDQIAAYIAQQNGLVSTTWAIPGHVTGLRLPWAPTAEEKKPKRKVEFGQVIAGIGAVAAGVGRIMARHQGGMPGNPQYPGMNGYPGGYQYGQPTQGDQISADIADAVPIIANLGAILSGSAPPAATPGYYGQPTYGYNQPVSPYSPPMYTPPTYTPPTPYVPPVYQPQPPVYQPQPPVYQPQPPIYQPQPPVYQPQPPFGQPTYGQPTYGPGTYGPNGSDPWANTMGTIVNSVGQLAQTFGQLFGKK